MAGEDLPIFQDGEVRGCKATTAQNGRILPLVGKYDDWVEDNDWVVSEARARESVLCPGPERHILGSRKRRSSLTDHGSHTD